MIRTIYTAKDYLNRWPSYVAYKYYDYDRSNDIFEPRLDMKTTYAISDSFSTDQAFDWKDELLEPTSKKPYLFVRNSYPTFHIGEGGTHYEIRLIKTHESMKLIDEIDGLESEVIHMRDRIKKLKARLKEIK